MNTSLSSTVPLGSPLYEQVKQAVLAALAQGEWKQGEAIPPEKNLAERFGVSIGTLRKAIDELAAENILVRHQGRGTYVAVHTFPGSAANLKVTYPGDVAVAHHLFTAQIRTAGSP